MNKWQRLKYQPNLPLGADNTKVTACAEHRLLSKDAAKEGMVLVKNDNNTLPISKGSKVALFGKATFDYVKGGGGSGDVTVEYIRNIYDGFNSIAGHVEVFEDLATFYKEHVEAEYKAGLVPGLTKEPSLPADLLDRAEAFADVAVISICRFSGEGWDRKSSKEQKGIHAEDWVQETAKQSDQLFTDGDFYLSKEEADMVEAVKKQFKQVVVVMNVGGMVDTEWFVDDDSISSVLMAWQGGMEGGTAAAELLCGQGNPSGKLSDTFAKELKDYPSTYNYHESKEYIDYTDDIYVGYRYFETVSEVSERVNYPFGFGLSYTDFNWHIVDSKEVDRRIDFTVSVSNVGNMAGKEVIQVYVMAPQGLLGKPAKSLVAFKKTRNLQAGETQLLSLSVSVDELASYDDLGKVQKAAYVLEAGDYKFFLGTSVRAGIVADYSYTVEADRVTKQLESKLVPKKLSKRMIADGSYESLETLEQADPDESVLNRRLPAEVEGVVPQVRYRASYQPGDLTKKEIMEVIEGKMTLDTFIDQLSNDELAHLLGGQPNVGVANTYGFGNLPEYGIPNVMTADGPAGLRINKECGVNTTAWPCSTLLACTWDDSILLKVGEAGAKEVKENNIGVWLTPAINIHRSPLCGRNFEYYSEDPLLAGKLAAAMVTGIQSVGVSATVKHFAFNNKETNRKNSDSRVSERAAREIYLKAFEIVVEEANPWCIMSAYNMVNGVRTSANRELLEDILRSEWGYKGAVTTDWWTYGEHYKEIKAGNDIKMASGHPERVLEALDKGAITREELIVSAKRVVELLMKLD